MGRFIRNRHTTMLGRDTRCIRSGIAMMLLWACAIFHGDAAGGEKIWRAPLKTRGLSVPRFFERNLGQVAPQAAFFSRGMNYDLFVAENEIIVALHRRSGIVSKAPGHADWGSQTPDGGGSPLASASGQRVLRIRMQEPDSGARVEGLQPLAGRLNYLIGKDPAKWRTNVPLYKGVIQRGLWPGIDLVYHPAEDAEFDLVLSPRAQPGRIRFALEGAHDATVDARGDLVVTVEGERLILRKPRAFQSYAGGGKPITVRYLLDWPRVKGGAIEVALGLSAYDPRRPLTIDPVLSYSSYLGGRSDGYPNGGAYAIAIDQRGNAYIAGLTFATDFPTKAGAFQRSKKGPAGAANAFVAKFNPRATGAASLVWATYLGGSGQGDAAYAIAVDGSGDPYVAGSTASPDFPTTANAYDRTCGTDGTCNNFVPDAFVTELKPDGSGLRYSTFLGGRNSDAAYGIRLDGSGHVFVAGATASPDFPVSVNAFQSVCRPCILGPANSGNAFVSELDPRLSGRKQLLYSTYLGGSNADAASGLALDSGGHMYLTGTTASPDFPHTSNAFQTACRGCANGLADAFVSKLDSSRSGKVQLVYSTFLGGSEFNESNAIAIDGAGRIYVTGNTTSPNFPTTPSSFAPRCTPIAPGFCDTAWIAGIDPSLSGRNSLSYSTYFGGGAAGLGITLDKAGMIYVTGTAEGVPTTPDAVGTNGCCGNDAFITKLSPAAKGASELVYSTMMAGNDGGHRNRGLAIALDCAGNFYVAGEIATAGGTLVPNFPITPNAFQKVCPDSPPPFPSGCDVAFISAFSPSKTLATPNCAPTPRPTPTRTRRTATRTPHSATRTPTPTARRTRVPTGSPT